MNARRLKMFVEDLMSQQVAACHTETNLSEATALMWENGCGALPVLEADGKLAGIVTDRDICIALGTRNLRASDLSVADVLQNQVLFCNVSDHIHTALHKMCKGMVRRLPVLDNNSRLAGMLSIDDIVLSAAADGKRGTAISYSDAVNALQTIHPHNRAAGREPAAA
jgi:CBS domain-containing protein